jgi:acyl carrier protein
MTEHEIAVVVHGVLREVFEREDLALSPSTTAKEVPGWDSFKQIEIVLALEARFGISFTTQDLDALRTVGDLVAVVCRKSFG